MDLLLVDGASCGGGVGDLRWWRTGSSPAANGKGPQSSWGGGGSAVAEPVGAFVIAGGEVGWLPAVDVTTIARRAVVAWALVALAGIRLARSRRIAVTVNRDGQAARR